MENILSNIKTIEPIKNRLNIIQYLPSIFLIGILFNNIFGNTPLYIILVVGLIISAIFASFKILFSGLKKIIIIGNIVINIILIISFTWGLFNTIRYLIYRL